MPRYLTLGLCLVMPLALANAETAPANDSDLAYSLGASLGERLRQEVPGLQLDALVEGLR
ncbi:MAG: FKBP-type peptidyl-prolyl cis-trans isomerase, partial [Pseudomonas sp.]|nr:FKBP-type peptidyl-prolyl cis-trans isomerase [Pseudomonas sp.]